MVAPEIPAESSKLTPPQPGSGCVQSLLLAMGGAAIVSISANTAHRFAHPHVGGNIVYGGALGIGEGNIGVDPEFVREEPDFNQYMVPTDPRIIPVRCIDGRDPVNDAPPGAKTAGGLVVTLQTALSMMGAPLPYKKVLELVGPGKRIPFIPGAHIDTEHSIDHHSAVLAPGVSGSGCGALDKQPKILQNFRDHSDKIGGVVRAVMGASFDQKVYDGLITKMQIPPHDPQKLIQELIDNPQPDDVDVLDALDHAAPNHNHHESWVVVNWVRNTTFDNRLLRDPTDQVFCVDAWLLLDIAQAYFPDDIEKQSELLHALVADQVATYYTLAGGHQRVAFVKPKPPMFQFTGSFFK